MYFGGAPLRALPIVMPTDIAGLDAVFRGYETPSVLVSSTPAFASRGAYNRRISDSTDSRANASLLERYGGEIRPRSRRRRPSLLGDRAPQREASPRRRRWARRHEKSPLLHRRARPEEMPFLRTQGRLGAPECRYRVPPCGGHRASDGAQLCWPRSSNVRRLRRTRPRCSCRRCGRSPAPPSPEGPDARDRSQRRNSARIARDPAPPLLESPSSADRARHSTRGHPVRRTAPTPAHRLQPRLPL